MARLSVPVNQRTSGELEVNVMARRKKLLRLVEKSKRGEMPRKKVDESYAAWRNHALKGNTFKLLQRMEAYYKELWERQ